MVNTNLNSNSPIGHPPVVIELPADLETPVSVYLKLAGSSPSFLLESVTGGERLARYSFIGVNPSRAYILQDGQYEIHSAAGIERTDANADPLALLRSEIAGRAFNSIPGLPRFNGGLVGYLGYEMVRYFEPSVKLEPSSDMPDAIFLLADTLVAFDHAYGRLVLIANPDPALDAQTGEKQAHERLAEIMRRLNEPLTPRKVDPCPQCDPLEMQSNIRREDFLHSVEIAKEHIAAGDIFQVVLSQRLSRRTSADAFSIYRALRRLNPSPYMFFFDFDGLTGTKPLKLIGASPELHVRLEGLDAAIRPIAGTRPRGKTPAEDVALEKELLADPKERAEHVMLVDLARNDLGRVCEYGSVRVPEQMVIERYSHVMHIVSHVEGKLRPEYDAFDLMAATFPAGTVSGAPKIRAMQIIDSLEGNQRGSYAGAVGYFAFDGSMDTCITIRTLRMQGDQISVQAGAGIVADSEPEREFQETINKARALSVAVDIAETESR
jgi:anthranilate synthase component 1